MFWSSCKGPFFPTLISFEFSRQISIKPSNRISSRSVWWRKHSYLWSDRRTDMMKAMDAFCDYANVSKNCRIQSAVKTPELNNIQFCSTHCLSPTANSFPLFTDHHRGSSEAVLTFTTRFQHLHTYLFTISI